MPTLRELREATGRTRAQVAADLDMSERHLQGLESGTRPLRRILAIAFANYYGVSVEAIEGRDSE